MNTDWLREALCAGAPTDLWFGEALIDEPYGHTGNGMRQRNAQAFTAAKTICRQCPVSLQCYELACANGERHGVWGGVTFGKTTSRAQDLRTMHAIWQERNTTPTTTVVAIRARQGGKPAARCGTESGYKAHRNRGEQPCGECRAAKNRGVLERARRRRLDAEQPARERAAEAWA